MIPMGAIFAVQRWVTSPGTVTPIEFRVLLLAAAPALTITLCARWVDAGLPLVDTRRDTYTRGDNQAER